jgi:hypothetical protein
VIVHQTHHGQNPIRIRMVQRYNKRIDLRDRAGLAGVCQ